MEEKIRTSEETLLRTGRSLLKDELSPNARVACTAIGGGLIALGTLQRAPLACVLGTIGIGLMLRGMSNLPISRLLGMGSGHHDMDMEKMSRSSAPEAQHDGKRGPEQTRRGHPMSTGL
jgi:hypothetical protein